MWKTLIISLGAGGIFKTFILTSLTDTTIEIDIAKLNKMCVPIAHCNFENKLTSAIDCDWVRHKLSKKET